jgi:hypothetical protein
LKRDDLFLTFSRGADGFIFARLRGIQSVKKLIVPEKMRKVKGSIFGIFAWEVRYEKTSYHEMPGAKVSKVRSAIWL